MRAACLLVVLIAAKLLLLQGQPTTASAWWLPAFLGQDVFVALVAAAADAILRRPRAGWIAYGAGVLYVAVGVPIARVLGSPLTPSMLRAARGPLADSIVLYLTP